MFVIEYLAYRCSMGERSLRACVMDDSRFQDSDRGLAQSSGIRSESQLQTDLINTLARLPKMENGALVTEIFETLIRMVNQEAERLDWKILSHSLLDMEAAFKAFFPHRHTRKITIFGSARTPVDRSEYRMAAEFARRVSKDGFMVMTGAGPGIMQAGNEGAGRDHSFGLNIQLPFEQGSNPVMSGDPKLVNFKYFFTRKLFFLKRAMRSPFSLAASALKMKPSSP